MQLKIYLQRKLCHGHTLLMLMLLLYNGNLDLLAQSCQLSQGQNGGVGLPVVSPITFERGNSNASKSHFAEGNSVPYRVEFTTLEANVQYKIRFGFEVKKNGKYALDYITGFQNLKSTSVDIPETVLPIMGTALENVAGINMHSFPIPSPNFSSEASFNSIAFASFNLLKSMQGFNPENSQPVSGLSNSIRDKGNMSIWNGIIDHISYVGNVNTSLQTVSAFVEVTFTKANNGNGVVLAWGGHIASLQDWGQNNSASSISGSPYHMFVDYVSRASDGNMICSGNMDCQLLADAVTPVPTCAISGPGRICAETSPLNYTATLDAASNGQVNYLWTLTNLNTSASAMLSGITSGNTNSSTLSASVAPASPYFTEGGSFLLQLSVERDGIVNYCYYNSADSPGIAIKVNDIVSSALASPASFSLNNRSASELSASVLLNGLSSENEFSYQWSLLNPGNYSGGNISNANTRTPTFTTAVADTFNFIVKLTQLSAPNCADSATVSLVVTPLQQCPTVVTDSVCAGTIGNVYSASFSPASGNTYLWSVSNDAQITSANGGASVVVDAGNSSFDLQLEIDYENPDFESLVCKYPVTVNPLPVISTGVYAPLCGSAMPISLDGLPSGGSWSGAGVSGNMFDPSSSGAGSHTLIYSYTDANGCSSSDTTSIVVNANPQVEAGSYGPYCASNSPVALQGAPVGGSWSGANVSGNEFTPANAGSHTLIYSYTDANGCSSSDTTSVVVNANPQVEAGSYGPYCASNSPVALQGSPAGGTWSGENVSGNEFTPVSEGSHTLIYSYTDANGCSSSDTVSVVVNANPQVEAGSYGPYCASNSPVALHGSPAGGTWSGENVSGNEFTPANAGSHTLIYSYTDANGCSSSDTTFVVVNANPQVDASSYGPYCASNSPVSLQGSPAGGTWFGTGVSGSYFDPIVSGAGTHMLTYAFITTAGCLTIDTIHIVVNSLPVVDAGVIDPVCSDTSDFVLTGTPAGGIWSGNGVTGSMFSPASAGAGVHTLVYSYTDANGCFNSDNVLIQVNSCVTVNACTYTQGYYGSKNGKSCDEDSLYNNAISLIKRLLSTGPIVIGSGNSTITILPTDSARVNAIMPGGGTPKSLSHVGNILLTNSQMSLYKGSGGRLNNNLLSQTIALALNLRIKEDLAGLVLETGYIHTQKLLTCNEGSGPVSCQQDSNAIKAWLMNSNVVNYLVENGGATVAKLLDLANAALGKTKLPGQAGNNGTSVPSLDDITNQIDIINNAFDKCRLFVDYYPSPILCNISNYRIVEQAKEKLANTITEFKVLAYPNPFQGVVNFTLESPGVSPVKIDLIDINGKMLGTFFEGILQAGDRKLVQVLPPKTTSPIIFRITTSTGVYTGKLIPLQ